MVASDTVTCAIGGRGAGERGGGHLKLWEAARAAPFSWQAAYHVQAK